MKHLRELRTLARQHNSILMVQPGGKHFRCWLVRNGKPSSPFWVSSTPSDGRAILNMKKDLLKATRTADV
jgi:hypothetical protein